MISSSVMRTCTGTSHPFIMFMQTKTMKQHNLATTMHKMQSKKLLLMHDSNMMHYLSACSVRASSQSKTMPVAELEHAHTW